MKNYCTGLLLPGERKSVEPMAARLAGDNVRRMHQSLHHVVADAPWSDEAVLDRCMDSTLPANTALVELVHLAKHRWVIERDYQELKQELGLGHYEGRGWRGFHHHATLCIAAYGFLVAERSRFSPQLKSAILDYPRPSHRQTSDRVVRRVRPERHNPRSITTLRTVLARRLFGGIAPCPFCGSRSG